jgi:hypothetical protein
MKTALYLYALLAIGLLFLAAWLITRIVSNGVDADLVAFLTVIFMAFRDVISKMGDCVRALNGQPVPEVVGE